MVEVDRVVNEVLRDGLDDWVLIDSLLWSARRAAGEGNDFRILVRRALEVLLGDRLMQIGDLGENGFEAWTSSVDESVDRAVRECEAFDWLPMGAGCWLSNTAEGDARGRLASLQPGG